MASTDYPLSVSSKFIDNAGTEHLVTVRGRNLEDFRGRLTEAGHIFPYAGFSQHQSQPSTPTQPTSAPTPINPVAATADQLSQDARIRHVQASNARKDAAPTCPIHQRKMLHSKHNSGFYCPTKVDDGYCDQKVAA